MSKTYKPVNVQRIKETIELLNRHLPDEGIEPLISVLESIKADPENTSLQDRLSEVFESLGYRQGAVLTYAPYISILLADDPFGMAE